MKVNLRMNLSHFLNKSFEERVIEKLGDIHRDHVKYYLTLWYEDGALNPTDIKQFIEKYESKLYFKTNIVVGSELKSNDFIWFDIIDKSNDFNTNRLRFRHVYHDNKDILKGLEEYHSCAKFCTSEKPPKRRKRNDYESSDSRK